MDGLEPKQKIIIQDLMDQHHLGRSAIYYHLRQYRKSKK
jgi:hypothetical protein